MQDWAQVTRNDDVESAYSSFNTIIQCAMHISCPLETITLKKKYNKNMWDVESQTLKSSYQEALNRELKPP